MCWGYKFFKAIIIVFIAYLQFSRFSQAQNISVKYCDGFQISSTANIGSDNTLKLQIPGPLSTNGNSIKFRLEKQKTKCQNKTIEIKLDKEKSKREAFTPSGYLRVNFHFFDSENYCILSENKNIITVSICPVDCTQSLCIPKCCPPDEVEDIGQRKCSFSGEKRWAPILHHEDETLTRLSDDEHTQFRPHYIESKARCKRKLGLPPYVGRDDFDETVFNRKDIRLLKDGTIRIRIKSKWKSITSLFCLDGIQNYRNDSEYKYHTGEETDFIVLRFSHCDFNDTMEDLDLENSEIQDIRFLINDVHAGLMLFSCLFLLLTIGVYILLWEKQNIHGWTITSYVVSLLFMYIFIATAKLLQWNENWFCVPNAFFAHFFFLATFCWLTIINFDVFWTFRDMKPNPMRSKEIKRYIFYFIGATGLPIFIIVIGQIIEKSECNSNQDCTWSGLISPGYGKMSCFLHMRAEGPYLYYPIGALLGFNLIFFCSTSFILYRHYQATKRVHDTPGNQSMELIKVFMKLFIVMGITWVLDLISWCFSSKETALYFVVFDSINILQAVAIFYIFVFKRQILTQLWNKYTFMRPILRPLKKLPCCKRSSFDLERSKSAKTLDRQCSRKDSLSTSRMDSLSSSSRKDSITNPRKISFETSFEAVEL